MPHHGVMSPVAAPEAPAARPSLADLVELEPDEILEQLRRALPDVRAVPVAAFQSSI